MLTHLLLDFDGTLADSSPGIYRSFSLSCEALGLPPPAEPAFRRLIGPPVQHIVDQIYPHLSSDDAERFRLVFRDDYDRRSFRLADWYPGVHEALQSLSDSENIRLTVVTNKPTYPACELIEAAALSSCFDSVIGVDYRAAVYGGAVFSTKAEAIAYALASASFNADRRLYVGDTPGDQSAAAACGLTFVAALYGFYQWPDHQAPLLCIDEFPQLLDLMNDRSKFLAC
jgi:phosphoglycolate phosphatase